MYFVESNFLKDLLIRTSFLANNPQNPRIILPPIAKVGENRNLKIGFSSKYDFVLTNLLKK